MHVTPACNISDMAAAAKPRGLSVVELVEKTMDKAGFGAAQRLYAGSNFCSQYFLRQSEGLWRDIFRYCEEAEIPLTLTIPLFTQKDLAKAHRRIGELLTRYERLIDEVTVNDLGMLMWCSDQFSQHVNAGRLFFKDMRDPRFPSIFEEHSEVEISVLMKMLFQQKTVRGIELDPTHASLGLSELSGYFPEIEIGVHTPYCYISTGNICEIGSIGQPVEKKFRANGPCALECAYCSICYEISPELEMVKWGRGVFFPNHGCRLLEGEAVRMIVSPFEVLL